MSRNDIQNILDPLSDKMDAIVDEDIKSIFKTLLNVIEVLVAENDRLRGENQKLRDENNHLKGEHGQPTIRKQTQLNQNISSESERKSRDVQQEKKSKSKKCKITIDRTKICTLDKSKLPSDAKFNGYQSVVVQDIIIKTNNIEFKKEKYYSALLKKTFIAELPLGYQGEFGPGVKALVLDLHHGSKMTESSIVSFMNTHGILISQATISRMLTDNHDVFHSEKKDIVQAGMVSSVHQQMDDTSARVNGKNYHTHILCNSCYTAYFTRPHKNRLTIIKILTDGNMAFQFNESSYDLMKQMNLSKKQLMRLRERVQQAVLLNHVDMYALLKELFPDPKKHPNTQRIILEATAIVAYQNLPQAIELLLTDDAPQFKQITELLALCWVHDGRHYKKLSPVIALHRKQLKSFLKKYWDYYHKLLKYKKNPTDTLACLLEDEFDELFSTLTGYAYLDERIKKTKLKKESLLLVLKYPKIPLHNNTSELGARTQARYRDISFHTINAKGTEAKDTFMTLVETSKKLAVNTYHYFYDRISKKYEMPSLASLIKSKMDGASAITQTSLP